MQRKVLPLPLSAPWILPDNPGLSLGCHSGKSVTTWALVQPKARCHSETGNTPALYSGYPIFRSQFRDRKIRLVSLTFLFAVFPQKSYRRTLNCLAVTPLLVPNVFSLQ
jgi:hypothetical protein